MIILSYAEYLQSSAKLIKSDSEKTNNMNDNIIYNEDKCITKM
jgi:hypothetical protein